MFTTVAGDLFTLEAVKEGLQTGGLCHTQWEQRVAEYINLLLEEPGNAANIALITAIVCFIFALNVMHSKSAAANRQAVRGQLRLVPILFGFLAATWTREVAID